MTSMKEIIEAIETVQKSLQRCDTEITWVEHGEKSTYNPWREEMEILEKIKVKIERTKSVFFQIADKIDKLNAEAKAVSVLSFHVDYSAGLVIQLAVLQQATGKTHNFTVVVPAADVQHSLKTDEEVIDEMFQPVFNALRSVQPVTNVAGTQLLDVHGDVIKTTH